MSVEDNVDLKSQFSCSFNWAEISEETDSWPKVQSVLSSFGITFDDTWKNLASVIDERGIRPTPPGVLCKYADSLFFGREDIPEVEVEDIAEPSEMAPDSSKPFGHLPGRMAYPKFDTLPQMGIDTHQNSLAMYDEMNALDLFGEEGDPIDEISIAICDLNRTETFTPTHQVSSGEFKEVNDATKKFQEAYQEKFEGLVLILGCGQVTLSNNFDFSRVFEVTYVDPVVDALSELEKRLEKVPYGYQIVCDTFEGFYEKAIKETVRYDVIVTNHSWHHICGGQHPSKQFENCKRLTRLLTDGGIWLGVGPSIGGMTSTPCSLEVRKGGGLYGFEKSDQDEWSSIAQFANVKYKEHVFFSGVLYGLEGGVSQVVHLSQFKKGEGGSDLLRMYEGFVFEKGISLPAKVRISVTFAENALRSLDLVNAVRLHISGRPAGKFEIQEMEADDKEFDEHTKGQLLLASHIPHLFFSGPFLQSEKLDGVPSYLIKNGEELALHSFGVKLTISKSYPGPDFECFCEYIDDKLYWLETVSINGIHVTSWIAGLIPTLPMWLGIKTYVPLSSSFEANGEGVVIHDFKTPCGSGKPRQYFLKWKTTIDKCLEDGSGDVGEFGVGGLVRNRALERHQPNGSTRALETPFVLSTAVVRTWLGMREQKEISHSDSENYTMQDVLSYPAFMGSTSSCKTRNTIVQQFWRGYVHLQPQAAAFVSAYTPFGRKEDAMVMGADLLHSILSGVTPDKDMIFVPEGVGGGNAEEVEGESLTVQQINDLFDD